MAKINLGLFVLGDKALLRRKHKWTNQKQNLLRTRLHLTTYIFSSALKRPRNLGRTHFLQRSNHLMPLMQTAAA
jgi:hypothetical protein